VEYKLNFWDIFGTGLIYLGLIIFAVIIVTLFIEYICYRKELKKKEKA